MQRYDVLVVGGGMAGCAAALAAAREGVSVLLIERAPCLGGNATQALVGPWQSYHASLQQPDGSLPPQVIGGIAQEFVSDLVAAGASLGHLPDPIGFAGSVTPVDAEALKLYLPAKLAAAGVEVHLGTRLQPAHIEAAAQVVDASGCAVAAQVMGAPTVLAEDRQPHSWLFTLEGVDTGAVRDYQLEHPDQFVLHPAFSRLRPDFIAVSGFFELVRVAAQRERFTIPRDRLLFFSTPRPGEVLVNTTRIPAGHPAPQAEGLRQISELAGFFPRHVPGFAQARVGRIACEMGERESRRLQGRLTLSLKDLAGPDSAEAVARGCYPVDIHRADSPGLDTWKLAGRGYYDIPLGSLETNSVPNLLCCGRCLSASREGFASARVLPTAMATGQASGMIAAARARGKKISEFACLSAISLV